MWIIYSTRQPDGFDGPGRENGRGEFSFAVRAEDSKNILRRSGRRESRTTAVGGAGAAGALSKSGKRAAQRSEKCSRAGAALGHAGRAKLIRCWQVGRIPRKLGTTFAEFADVFWDWNGKNFCGVDVANLSDEPIRASEVGASLEDRERRLLYEFV